MELAELQREKLEITAKIQEWERRMQQAHLEIAAWTGHAQRVDIWFERIAERQHVDAVMAAAEVKRVPVAE